MNKDKVREKFVNIGGIPYYIFGDDEIGYENTRESKIISCSSDSFLRSLRDCMKNEDYMIHHMKCLVNDFVPLYNVFTHYLYIFPTMFVCCVCSC